MEQYAGDLLLVGIAYSCQHRSACRGGAQPLERGVLLIGFHSTTDEEHKLIKAGAKKKKEYKDCFIHDDIRPFSELDDAAKDIDWKLVNRTYT